LLTIAFLCIALNLAAQSAPKVDRIVIEKSKRTMTLLDGTKAVKSYKVALGGNPKEQRTAKAITKLPRAYTQ